jgi:hypothetical protein
MDQTPSGRRDWRPRKFFEGLTSELEAFAESEFALLERQDDGETLKTHLQSLFRQSGKMPAQLAEAPGLPVLCNHIWNWFTELHNERRNGERLSLTDIREWSQTVGMPLETWELAAIRRLDTLWLKAQYEHGCSDTGFSS